MSYRTKAVLPNIPTSAIDPKDYINLGAMGLCGEAGEVSEVIKKFLFQGAVLDRNKLLKELGDVRWYFELLCIALNTTIEEVEAINMEKLAKRFPNGFTVDDSAKRVDEVKNG